MTKAELLKIALEAYVSNRYTDSERRLNRCHAWYYMDEGLQAVALRSYSSVVAVYWCDTVWELNHWSATTTQHVRKFAKLMGAPVVSLYRVSSMGRRAYEAHATCDWSDVIQAVIDTL